MKIEEEFTGDGWRPVGKEPVEEVVLQTNSETVVG